MMRSISRSILVSRPSMTLAWTSACETTRQIKVSTTAAVCFGEGSRGIMGTIKFTPESRNQHAQGLGLGQPLLITQY